MADPARTAVLCDLDGTLAELVDDPATAAPLPGAEPVLAYLAGHLRTVAVVSGRPLAFLEAHLGRADGVLLAGLYGLERTGAAGAGAGARFRPQVADAVAEARADLPAGARLEDKGIALALHYREAPGFEAAVSALADRLAGRHGLRRKPAKLAVELVPPVDVDKGTVTAELAAGCAAACFLGDDAGDLAAFDALAGLVQADRLGAAVRVAVAGAELPPGLLRAADLVVDGPSAAVGFLEALAERLGYRPSPS